MSKIEKLLPCPIEACGSTEITLRNTSGVFHGGEAWCVSCDNCGVCGRMLFEKQNAIDDWNDLPRTEPPKVLDWPDSEGMWWMSSPGGVVVRVRAKANGGTFDAIYDSGSLLPRCHARTHRYRFIKAEPPTFPRAEPEYPPKPTQVLATHGGYAPRWRTLTTMHDVEYAAENYTIIDHPDNDPEALRMIEEARDVD